MRRNSEQTTSACQFRGAHAARYIALGMQDTITVPRLGCRGKHGGDRELSHKKKRRRKKKKKKKKRLKKKSKTKHSQGL